MLSPNHFLVHCSGAELFVKSLGHAHKANANQAARLRRGGRNKCLQDKLFSEVCKYAAELYGVS